MLRRYHVFPELMVLGISLLIQLELSRRVLAHPAWQSWRRRSALVAGNLAVAGILVFSFLSSFGRIWRHLSSVFGQWVEASGLILSTGLIGLYLGVLVWRRARVFQPERRQFVKAAGVSLALAPCVGISLGVATGRSVGVSEIDVRIPNLPKDLDGLRLVQITDIHLGPFFSENDLARSIDMANEARAHVALVTGDLISRPGDPLDACLRQLARLRAEAGVLGCLGNHEIYTNTEDYVTEQGRRFGLDFLRLRSRLLRFGTADLNFAGVDYQPMKKPYLAGAETLLAPNATNILLSHNPDVFPVAARQGYDLTVAGHTHGGQVNFEILHQNLNVALYFTRFVRGLYSRQGKSIYVGSGLGTIGVPVRLGAPPEVSVIRLRAS